MNKYINGSWSDGTPSEGDTVQYISPQGGIEQCLYNPDRHAPADKSAKERQWRDGELERTDKFVVIPDSPKDYLPYRAELRDYPAQPDFPNGTRPEE